MFPGANARVFTNEEGEVIGWDYPSSEPEERDPYDDFDDLDWDEDVEEDEEAT